MHSWILWDSMGGRFDFQTDVCWDLCREVSDFIPAMTAEPSYGRWSTDGNASVAQTDGREKKGTMNDKAGIKSKERILKQYNARGILKESLERTVLV